MTECKSNILKAYKDGDFRVEITDDGNAYGAWLSSENYGIKTYMFGAPTKWSLVDFIDIVKNNLALYELNYIRYVEGKK